MPVLVHLCCGMKAIQRQRAALRRARAAGLAVDLITLSAESIPADDAR